MKRTIGYVFLGLVICAVPGMAADTKDAKAVTGKVKSVDAAKNTVTITTADGKDHTFMVMKETKIMGPKGGRVPKRLKDDRLEKGAEVTIVPGSDGKMAQEVHLAVRKPAVSPAKDK